MSCELWSYAFDGIAIIIKVLVCLTFCQAFIYFAFFFIDCLLWFL